MLRRLIFILSLMALLLGGCSTAAPTTGDLKDFSAACDKANDGKRIAIVGYLRFPESFTGSDNVVLRMYNASDFSGSPIGVTVDFGTKANQVEPVKDQFSDNDLKVHMANGQVAGLGTKVKVSGTVYFPLVSQEFACGLYNPLVDAGE